MSIRSIDMQVLIPKAMEVGKQQNNLTQQSTIQQQQFAEQMAKTAAVRQHQVQSIVKGQGNKIERDGKQGKNNKQQDRDDLVSTNNAASKESPETGDSAEEVRADPVLGHIIDIKT